MTSKSREWQEKIEREIEEGFLYWQRNRDYLKWDIIDCDQFIAMSGQNNLPYDVTTSENDVQSGQGKPLLDLDSFSPVTRDVLSDLRNIACKL